MVGELWCWEGSRVHGLLSVLCLGRNYVKAYIDFPKPLVGVVNGPAVGISVTVLGLFDLVYATDRVSVLKAGLSTHLSPLSPPPPA